MYSPEGKTAAQVVSDSDAADVADVAYNLSLRLPLLLLSVETMKYLCYIFRFLMNLLNIQFNKQFHIVSYDIFIA